MAAVSGQPARIWAYKVSCAWLATLSGQRGVRLLVRLSGHALCQREEIAIAGLKEGMECFYWASGGPFEYEIEREALHVSTSAASRGHVLFALLQFRWEPPERELSRGWKDDQRTEDETLSEE